MKITMLAYKSLLNRKLTIGLTVSSIAVSIALLLGVGRLRSAVEQGFTNTISKTDLVVGARTGEEQLVLASVFHLGDLTNEVSWGSYQHFKNDKRVKWTIPISFGDSHKGFEVIGTNEDLFEHYKYGDQQALRFAKGERFQSLFDVVIGADVAEELEYEIGNSIVIQHGSHEIGAHSHDDLPFNVIGILDKTGTPLDGSLFIKLEALEGMHIGYTDGQKDEHLHFSKKELQELNLTPLKISAFFVGLHNRADILGIQQELNNFEKEALTAASPAFTLINLWSIMEKVETVLFIISIFVLISSLTSMLIALLTGIKERRREMAILRSLGATSQNIYALIVGESFLITLAGVLVGSVLLFGISILFSPVLENQYGLIMKTGLLQINEFLTIAIVLFAGVAIGFIPAYKVHRLSLKDGMTIKI